MFIHLGLTTSQEATISDIERDSAERSLKLLERSGDLDKSFAGIVKELMKASEYKVIQREEPTLESVDLG